MNRQCGCGDIVGQCRCIFDEVEGLGFRVKDLEAKLAELERRNSNQAKTMEWMMSGEMMKVVIDKLEFISSGCLVPPDGGSPDIMDAVNAAKEAMGAIKK